MCCLTIYKTNDDNLVITHNRDEVFSRQLAANSLSIDNSNGRKTWMPKDGVSNGTWIGTDGKKAAAILNGYKENHVKKSSYKASRGGIIPAFFEMEDAKVFTTNFDPIGLEPFTLLMIHDNHKIVEYGWDEKQVIVNVFDANQPLIYSSATLYDNRVKRNRKQVFIDFLQHQKDENDLWDLHVKKGDDHNLFLNVAYNESISTVAISQIVLGKKPMFYYQTLINETEKQIYNLQ